MSIFKESDLEIEEDFESVESQEITESYPDKVKRHMIQFFEDKTTCDGHPISLDRLLTEDNISMVMNASIEAAMEIIYTALNSGFDDMDEDSGLIGDDVKIVLTALKKCSEAKVPQEFVGGMTLLYLEFCKGLNFE